MTSPTVPSRSGTMFSEDAVPESDPSSTVGLLAERLQAWRHAVSYMTDYMDATDKIHKSQAKEYEKVLKTISKPLKEGHHFDQEGGGVATFFENMRANTQALINTNAETATNIKGSVLPILERLHKEIKSKGKELHHGAEKGAKDVEKARNTTQKYIELLGQNTAAFESSGGKLTPNDDPYVVRRGVIHRLNKQVQEENNHHNDLIAVQTNFQAFEVHVVEVLQQAMEAFNQFVSGQAERQRMLYADMLGALQRVPPEFEWTRFTRRKADILVNPEEAPRTIDAIAFPNMDHSSAKALIEGSLQRKSRNKLSWGWQTSYYVVTPSKFLHEFKDDDDLRVDPKPELSIYLPDAIIGAPNGDRFNVKGKDKSKTMSSKLAIAGSSELAFKAHTPEDALRWFEIIRNVAGATGPAAPLSPTSGSASPEAELSDREEALVAAKAAAASKGQESGLTPATTAEPATAAAVPPATAAAPAAVTADSPVAAGAAGTSVATHPAPVGTHPTVASPTTAEPSALAKEQKVSVAAAS